MFFNKMLAICKDFKNGRLSVTGHIWFLVNMCPIAEWSINWMQFGYQTNLWTGCCSQLNLRTISLILQYKILEKLVTKIQWGSEIRPFEIRKRLKSWLFEGGISNGPVFKRSGLRYGDFKWFSTKWGTFVRISNGWVSRFQIPFEIQIICNPTSLDHSKSRLGFPPYSVSVQQNFIQP